MPENDAIRRGPRRARLLVAQALLIGAAIAVVGCGGATAGDADGLRRTDDGMQTIAKTDPATGLRFEVQTSTRYGVGNSVYVRATKATRPEVRAELEGRHLALSCRIRGTKTPHHPLVWDDLDELHGTLLYPDDGGSAAERVLYCMLVMGIPCPDGQTHVFSQDRADAYSSVTFR